MIWNEVCRAASITVLILLVVSAALAKEVDDVVVLKNGDRLTGEIKGLQSGELRIKADYMAESVRLDWAKVERLESKSTFMIWLVDGKLVTDVMRLLPKDSGEVANFVIGNSDQTVGYGSELVIPTKDAESIESVVLVRNPTLTHLTDADQRSVELPIVSSR